MTKSFARGSEDILCAFAVNKAVKQKGRPRLLPEAGLLFTNQARCPACKMSVSQSFTAKAQRTQSKYTFFSLRSSACSAVKIPPHYYRQARRLFNYSTS
jgi:hypothetical protein